MSDVTSVSLHDRYVGTLLGLACGDALGGPVEFVKRDEIEARFPNGVSEFIGGGWLRLAPGEVTDDTQQALILAESLTTSGLDLDRFAAGLIAWFRGNPKDVGNTTRIALEALAAGTAPLEAGAMALATRGERSAAANGAVMRCAPVALRFRRDPSRLVRDSLDSARVTHAEARASWGTVAVNQAIVHLLEGGAIAKAAAAAVVGIPNREVLRGRAQCGGTAGPRGSLRRICPGDDRGVVLVAAQRGQRARSNRDGRRAWRRRRFDGAVTGALAGAAYGFRPAQPSWVETVQFRERLVSEAVRLLALSERERVEEG